MNLIKPICGMCDGRNVNDEGSECEFCDCGIREYPLDFAARVEVGNYRDPNFKFKQAKGFK